MIIPSPPYDDAMVQVFAREKTHRLEYKVQKLEKKLNRAEEKAVELRHLMSVAYDGWASAEAQENAKKKLRKMFAKHGD